MLGKKLLGPEFRLRHRLIYSVVDDSWAAGLSFLGASGPNPPEAGMGFDAVQNHVAPTADLYQSMGLAALPAPWIHRGVRVCFKPAQRDGYEQPPWGHPETDVS